MTDSPPTTDSRDGLVVIAHGSRRRQANDDLHALVHRLRLRGFPLTFAAFLELVQPDIVTAGNQCVNAGAARVVLLPYFLSAGVHVVEDLETARRELQRVHGSVDFRVAGPLGPDPLLEELLLARAQTALSSPNAQVLDEISRSP